MVPTQASGKERSETEELREDLKEPLRQKSADAWVPADGDLWIPYRIRGSWRGGVLG